MKDKQVMSRREAKGVLSAFKDRKSKESKFHLHTTLYLLINFFFLMLNVIEGPNAPVFMFPVLIWGVVLAMHWKRVYGMKGAVTKEWEEAMIHELMYGEEMPDQLDELLLHARAAAGKKQLLKLPKASKEDAALLQKRIENLEAIITSQRWDEIEKREEELAEVTKKVEEISKQFKG